MESGFVDVLLELPLFQGLGKSVLAPLMEAVPLTPVAYGPGKFILRQDTPCTGLVFLLTGSATRHTVSDNRRYAFQERIAAPCVLQPEVLYGFHSHYTHSFIARSDTQILTVSKKAVNQVFMNQEVFRLNFINLLSTLAYRRQRPVWNDAPAHVEQRIIRFIHRHAQYPAGEKVLNIRMADLAELLNETRIHISKALNAMQHEGLLSLRRKEIRVPALETLLCAYP